MNNNESALKQLQLGEFITDSGRSFDLSLSYQIFGPPLHQAPVVLVNHALTGNSEVSGPDGWWKDLIGPDKAIDTRVYTVLCFNIPGNGFDGQILDDYREFVARDVARIFLKGLALLGVERLFALIGGSLGGGIAWEMAVLSPRITHHLIPVATDWKSTDWLIANCQIQERFLLNSKDPVHDARMHAMLCYRTPVSFKNRFQRTTNDQLQVFNVESWLLHHGKKLQERFQLGAYKLMNQLLKTIDVTRNREGHFDILNSIDAHIHIVGVNSDLFFTAEENRETYRQLAQSSERVSYAEIESVHGHDAFLIEFQQLQTIIGGVFEPASNNQRMKILKFGGRSLANGTGLDRVLDIVETKHRAGEKLTVVVSARNNATDELENLLKTAASRQDYGHLLTAFKSYQENGFNVDLSEEFTALDNLLAGVALLGDYSDKVKDEVLAQGELLSARLLTGLLQERSVKAHFADTRKLLVTSDEFGNAHPLEKPSREKVEKHFAQYNGQTVNVVTGFIGANVKQETTTLGRNGSNYTASLLANYLNAGELENYTHVDGIYTANPDLVPHARKIDELSFNEANEMANFGAHILHAKTIIPLLEKNIPLRILNTFKDDNRGTLISTRSSSRGIRSLNVLEKVSLINLEGRGLLGKAGVDARIFKALAAEDISVSIISQGSSERGIGLVVDESKTSRAIVALEREFERDFYARDVNKISATDEVAVISIIGQDLSTFHKPYTRLIRNKVVPLLFNNTVTGKNVSLVVQRKDLHKALNVIHGEIFGVSKTINIAVFGHGNVGGSLIEQILSSAARIEERKKVRLNIFAVANSRQLLLDKEGVSSNWQHALDSSTEESSITSVIRYAEEHHLENLIAVDNTASRTFTGQYRKLVEAGFDLVSSNKIANTLDHQYYRDLRQVLEANQKQYLYETNVGAGLPLIDTIRILHLSGENITGIRGVFSGTLSYLFNRFSVEDKPFSEILADALALGYTEPDPREDLNGSDVGRKLLILARELDLINEMEDVSVESLVPAELNTLNKEEFIDRLSDLDARFEALKRAQQPGHVLRYIGDLSGDLQQDKGQLTVKLVSVPGQSVLGRVQGADSIFEIYTESYGEHPVVIQGAGAGAAVTARGVFGDILKLSERNSI